MIRPFLAVVVIAVVGLVALRDHWVHVAGLTGSCAQVAANGDGTVVEACQRGRLEGWPDLGSHNCTAVRNVGGYQYWHCPTPLTASQVGR